jgi:hypothetical protein
MKKNVSAAYIALFLTLAAFAPLAAQAESGFETGPDGSGVAITKYTGPGGDVAIPAAIGGKSVTSIGAGAFAVCLSLKPEIRADIEKRFGSRVF